MGIIQTLFFGAILCLVQVGYAQVIPTDPRAKELLELGKRYLKTHNYTEAVETFEQIDKTKFNTVSTAGIFLSGIAWMEAGNREKALAKFTRILNYYPESKYTLEAKYHKGILLLQDLTTREYGLKMLMDVVDQTKDRVLIELGKQAISQYLYYESDVQFLDYYLKVARESYKSIVAEALCLHYMEQRQFEMVVATVNRIDSTDKRLTPRLKLIKDTFKGIKSMDPPKSESLKVALLMPFYASDQDSDMVVSSKSLIALEFLEGMKMAVEDYRAANPLQLDLVAWDVRRDSFLTKRILKEEALDQDFDVVIGSYFNNESRVISDWADTHKITHIVPYSPESYLSDHKQSVFLASPALKTHAVKMADYAVNFQGFKKLVVFTSDDRFTSLMAESFINRAEENKAVVIVKKYVSNPDKAQSQIPDLVKQIAQLGVDAVYIPSSNEEMVSLIISHMRFHKIQATILGSPEFRNFRALDKELLDQFTILFSDAVFEMNDVAQAEAMVRRYAMEYGHRLSLNVIRGYDLMNYLLHFHSQSDCSPIFQCIPTVSKWKGISQNYYYSNYKDNQSLFILRLEGRSVSKVYEY